MVQQRQIPEVQGPQSHPFTEVGFQLLCVQLEHSYIPPVWEQRDVASLATLFNRLDRVAPSLIPIEVRNQPAREHYIWLYQQGLVMLDELSKLRRYYGELWQYTGD